VLLVHHKIAFAGLFYDVGENGLLIRFRDQFRSHFYGQASREKYGRAIELEPALLQWVDQYNSSHRFRCWPNWDEPPKERVDSYRRTQLVPETDHRSPSVQASLRRASFTGTMAVLEGGGHDLSDFVVDTPLHSP
jgi:hypothetical protein